MGRIIDYMVLSMAAGFGNHDHGSWSEHRTLKDARETAVQVSAEAIYRRTRTTYPDGKKKETWRRLYS